MAVSAYAGLMLTGDGQDAVRVAVAARDLPAGMQLQEDDYTLEWAVVADPDRYLHQPAAGTLSRSVGRGELIPAAAIGGGAGDQQRLVAVPVDAERLPPTVQRGARVDVWLAGTGSPVLAGASVVDVADPEEWTGATATVVLAVDPDAVADLLAATRAGAVDITGYEAVR